MPPTRTNPSQRNEGSSKHASGSSRPRSLKSDRNLESQTPGVQKVKASIRQTRRLLAKNKLAADVRVETERRLKALESELAQAEVARKERTLATRYHRIKFFERQKVMRKLKQVKKEIAASEKPSKKLTKNLLQLRVDLNYILHYPKLSKYVSLFPPEIRQGEGEDSSQHVEPESTKTSTTREEIRTWIREQMEKGELSQEPELHLGSRTQASTKQKSVQKATTSISTPSFEKRKSGGKEIKTVTPVVRPTRKAETVQDDAFFGDDSDDDDGGGGGGDGSRHEDEEDEDEDEDDESE